MSGNSAGQGGGESCRCIVKDCSNQNGDKTNGRTWVLTNLSLSSTVETLVREVGRVAGYEVSSFRLVWSRSSEQGGDVTLDSASSKSLREIDLSVEDWHFEIRDVEVQDHPPSVARSDSNSSVIEHNSYNSNHYASSTAPPNYSSTGNAPPSYSSVVQHGSQSDSPGFVGLINQAMTCYLNSLLQTLYMTPEFRNALYKWKFDGVPDDEERSIPFQLQKLFANLQTSKRHAVETTDVTKSFGWDSSEAWQQHDVQELCRVMFDALETKFKDTDQEHLIKQLYEGKMQDYVKCLECGNESARTDTYLDIPLVIKPFGAKVTFASVEEALQAFVTPEILQGTNQYSCERCNKKCDAHKGLKFIDFPYLLTLQLKRFDFDYSTMYRIKLNDLMSFPKRLDLNGFVAKEGKECEFVRRQSMSGGLVSKQAASEGVVTASASTPNGLSNTSDPHEADSMRGKEAASGVSTGPYVYDLFSIMVHSGSAIGGHYYAYIRSFDNDKWYSFNDSMVTPITDEDIKKTFGGTQRSSSSYYSSQYASSANAYMLMYRQVTHCNAKAMARNELPEHVNRLVKQVEEQEEEGRRQMELDRTMCKIKVFYQGKIGDVAVGKRLEVHKDKTLREAVEVAHKLFELEGTVPVDQCRLVKYDDFYESFERSFEGMEETSMGQLLGGVRQSYLYDLLLESRHSDEEFDIYTPNGCTLKVFVINLAEGKVELRHIVHTSLNCTIGELKKILERKYRYPAAILRLAVEKTYMDHTLLSSASSSLRSEGFYRSGKLYIETVGETTKGPFNQTRFFSVLDSFVHGIALHVTLPAPVPEAGNESSEAAVPNGLASTSFGSSDPDGTSQKSGGTVSGDGKAGKSEPAAPTGREVTLRVDKRITVSKFKELLSQHVGAATDQFKLFRSYPNGQEFEVTRPNDTLSQYSNDTKIVVKMGRALRAGEVRIKLFLLRPSEVEFAELLTESIVCKGMTVAQLKEQLVKELKAAGSSVQLHAKRMRLRKKTWKDPRTVLFDHYKFDEEIMIYPGWEGFVQELAGDDAMTSGTQTAVFVRQWKPSSYTLGPIEEIILDDTQVSTLKASISKLSGIPVANVDFAKPRNSFPCDTNVLELEDDVSWNPAVSSLSQYPLYITDDGTVVYYRDCTEKLQSLTDEQRLELQKRETARLQRSSASRTTYSYSRKEKALKIYTDTSSKPSSDNEA